MAKKLTGDEIAKLPLNEADKMRLAAHYGVGYTPKATMARADALAAMGRPVAAPAGDVEDLGGDDRPTTPEQKAADAKAAAYGYPAVKVIQPTGYSVPVAPASSSISKIAPPEAPAVAASGPALGVDSYTPGLMAVPKSSFTGAPDYGSASVPYEGGELGGLGIPESGDKIVAKKPKEMQFEPDPLVVQMGKGTKIAKGK